MTSFIKTTKIYYLIFILIAFVVGFYVARPFIASYIYQRFQKQQINSDLQKIGLEKQPNGTFQGFEKLDLMQKIELSLKFSDFCKKNGIEKIYESFDISPKGLNDQPSELWKACRIDEADGEVSSLEKVMKTLGIEPTLNDRNYNGEDLYYKTPTNALLLRSGFGVYFGTYVSDQPAKADRGVVTFKLNEEDRVLTYSFDRRNFKKIDVLSGFKKGLTDKKPIEISIDDPMGNLFIQVATVFANSYSDGIRIQHIELYYVFKPSAHWSEKLVNN